MSPFKKEPQGLNLKRLRWGQPWLLRTPPPLRRTLLHRVPAMTWVGTGNLHRYRVMFLCTYDWVSLLMVVFCFVVVCSLKFYAFERGGGGEESIDAGERG
jgi:hypothetical protein